MKKSTQPQHLTNTFFTLVLWLSSVFAFAAPVVKHSDPVIGNSPVSMNTFSVKESRNAVDIQWSTSRETNTNLFIVQRSFDGKVFTEISTIVSGDDSYATKKYNVSDDRLTRKQGIVYYRLKIVDRDGQFVYSDIKVITKERMPELHY